MVDRPSRCRGDADLRRFLTHLVAAIQTPEPEAGIEALALLEAGGAIQDAGGHPSPAGRLATPAAYETDLATSLNNLSNHLANAGRKDESERVSRENP